MIIQDLFSKDINRSINGVVKVQDASDESVRQELDEYVVTRELQGHFAHFFEAYDKALDVPTDNMGVWISGFFGSGKSHFLKMLSYLLQNDEIAGKRAVDYFDGKISDPIVAARVRRCCEVPTEAILFNIDSKGGQWKEGDTSRTALLRAFERVFFEHLGFLARTLSSRAWSSISTARARRRSSALPTSALAAATGSRTARAIATLRMTSSRPCKRSWA